MKLASYCLVWTGGLVVAAAPWLARLPGAGAVDTTAANGPALVWLGAPDSAAEASPSDADAEAERRDSALSSRLDRAPPSPGAQVERLIASGDARDALRAFRLVTLCLREREQAKPRVAAAACQGINAGHMRARRDLVEAAARAGVPGAVTAWTAEGPFGDRSALTQRPDDPLVAAWVVQAVEQVKAAAQRDDVDAIMQLGWLTMHWDMNDAERLDAMMRHADDWERRRDAGALAALRDAGD